VTPGVGLAELEQAIEAVDTIIKLRNDGRASFDASADRRWALAFLWVNVGSALKQFCRLRGIEQGSPFPGPIRMRDRLCYRAPSTVSSRILWDTCVYDAGPLAVLLRASKLLSVESAVPAPQQVQKSPANAWKAKRPGPFLNWRGTMTTG